MGTSILILMRIYSNAVNGILYVHFTQYVLENVENQIHLTVFLLAPRIPHQDTFTLEYAVRRGSDTILKEKVIKFLFEDYHDEC